MENKEELKRLARYRYGTIGEYCKAVGISRVRFYQVIKGTPSEAMADKLARPLGLTPTEKRRLMK